MSKMRPISEVTPEAFVLAWEAAPSVDACADALRITPMQCCGKAAMYRSRGVNLKRFRGHKADVGALNKLIGKGDG